MKDPLLTENERIATKIVSDFGSEFYNDLLDGLSTNQINFLFHRIKEALDKKDAEIAKLKVDRDTCAEIAKENYGHWNALSSKAAGLLDAIKALVEWQTDYFGFDKDEQKDIPGYFWIKKAEAAINRYEEK